MTDEFIRFPSTAHLWVAPGAEVRNDKVLDASSRDELLDGDLLVEEKIDGDNVGFSVLHGEIRAQHRGDYIRLDEGSPYPFLRSWIATHHHELLEALGDQLIVFGEWCALVHTVRYHVLPDWFLAFDVYDKSTQRFFGADRRDTWCRSVGLQLVPELARGRFTLDALRQLMGDSRVGAERMEGIVVRRDDDAWLSGRAKLVRSQFVQANELHWRRREPEFNRLATAAVGPPSV